VLLDLKLPRKSGLEVLAWLRGHDTLRRLPVVVLTSSREAPDVRRAYDLGANSYLVKPVGFEALRQLVETLGLYWLTLNEPPDTEG
jgi:CheY-like chemotaxis protein